MLARAERELGLDSWCVSLEPVHPGFPVDEVLFERVRGGRLGRELSRWAFLRRTLASYDVVHFNFGSSLLPRAYPAGLAPGDGGPGRWLFRLYARLVENRDLGWLRQRGTNVVVTYQGDDARQADVARARFDVSMAAFEVATPAAAALDRRRRAWIAAFDRHADRIYALNPDLLHVLPARAEFLPYAHVDPREWRAEPRPAAGPPVVLHAPTDPARKGTEHVLAAVERLRADGIDFEFRLLDRRLPRDEAREVYREADLLVDQLLAGWYGGVAVELMALGRPVVAYLREEDLGALPAEMRAELPVVNATPETVERVLRSLLTERRAELPDLGARSRRYVERWHDPLDVARRLKRDYETILSLGSRP
jgi:glycosyltransferase involved in cell wall biosynthesis